MTFGERIRQLRLASKLSLRALGSKIGKTAPFLSDIELGQRFPSEAVLESLAAALGTTPDDLIQHDTRIPVRQMRALLAQDPGFGPVFRKMVEVIRRDRLSPEELLRRIESGPPDEDLPDYLK
jgi:transcriptional regulator with XRE-family HTH domain